ncbi:MAG: transcriptional regulator, partial [Mogibacterium sp.]|nr:transcriptional regulator [Mogibacterium sp.]
GKLEGNPVREDLEEACAMLGVDFIVNCVLDEHKKIVYAVAGDVVKAHRVGCRYLDRMYRVSVHEPADIILVSQGGAPKDANLYQTQKALDNSKHIIKDGGTIILIGACNEGLGNATFEKWLTEADKPQDLIDRIHADFKLGGHKAAAIAMVMQKADIYLISEMDPDFVKSLFFTPAATAQAAFDEAMKKHGPDARVIAMPFGGAVLPSVE